MKRKIIAFMVSIMMVTAVIVSYATPAFAGADEWYIVPPAGKQTVVRESPEKTKNGENILQFLKAARNEYCIYSGQDITNDQGEVWHCVSTIYGVSGYVQKGAGQIVKTKPVASTTMATTTTTTKAATTTKKTTSTTKATTAKSTTTTTTQKSSKLYYLTCTGDYTNIRSGASTSFAKVGKVTKREIVIADNKVNGWYHLIQKDSKKMDGWCKASLMKEVPAPTTVSTTVKPTSAKTTTTVKPTTTKSTTKKPTTTSSTTKSTTKKPTSTTTTTKYNGFYVNCVCLAPGDSYERAGYPPVLNSTSNTVIVRLDPKYYRVEIVEILDGDLISVG